VAELAGEVEQGVLALAEDRRQKRLQQAGAIVKPSQVALGEGVDLAERDAKRVVGVGAHGRLDDQLLAGETRACLP
jgi:hypothetical protein